MGHEPDENNLSPKLRAPKNRTLTLSRVEERVFSAKLVRLSRPVAPEGIENCTINQDLCEILEYLPSSFVDLLFVDPPYNLNKGFRTNGFKEMRVEQYECWVDSWLGKLQRILRPNGSVYICGDWRSSSAIFRVMSRYFVVRNRITWEREKGRGANRNWKSSAEDIWFGTVSDDYTFNIDAVKLKRKVIAPYRDRCGNPKDWIEDETGAFRLTHPSNLWTDLTIPFWSMPENTDHPTQKPEKLLAKVILASSIPGHFVFDPFLGSGTTSVVAKKLGRRYCGVESDKLYCCLAEKRLALAEQDKSIQGYCDGVFWERNTLRDQMSQQKPIPMKGPSLFHPMIKSKLFYTEAFRSIEERIASFLNAQADFLSERTAASTRAVGDAIQNLIAENFQTIAGNQILNYSSAFARRAMADLAFSDAEGFYYVVDVKTHRLDTKFNMPNLTSVERLARFYEDDKNYFIILIIAYNLDGIRVTVDRVHFVPIEFLSWECLTIGALGWGQIQIANSNKIVIIPHNSRKEWMIDMCDTLLEFYPSEISKIGERIEYFKKVKQRWENKTE